MKSTLLEDELTEKPPDKKITLQEDNLTLPVHVQRGFREKNHATGQFVAGFSIGETTKIIL